MLKIVRRISARTLLHIIGECEGLREVTVAFDLARLFFVQIIIMFKKRICRVIPLSATFLFCSPSQMLSLDQQTLYTGFIFLLALLLELLKNKHPVSCAPGDSEAKLDVQKVFFSDSQY